MSQAIQMERIDGGIDSNGKENDPDAKEESIGIVARTKVGLVNMFDYTKSKVRQVIGLELTPGQFVYWNAVQRRMILGLLEDLINGNTKLIHNEDIQVPYKLACGLIRDQAIRNYLEKYLEAKKIYIALPVTARKSVHSLGSDVTDGESSIRPCTLMKVAEQDDEVDLWNEEEDIESKGSFLMQGYRAVCTVKDKCKDKLSDSKATDAKKKQDAIMAKPSFNDAEISLIDKNEQIDDLADEVMNDVIYDSLQRGIIRSSSPTEGIDTTKKDDDSGFLMIGGRSFKPAFTSIVEYIPFVLTNFQFKHVVRNITYSRTEKGREKERDRNAKITKDRHRKLKEIWKLVARWPLFTYWLMFVQTVIFIITVSVYGFAPFGYVPFTEVALIQQSNLSVEVLGKDVTPNIWLGPPQDALVLLGANYGPCMRRDRLLYDAIEQDRRLEADQSGCCVRRDGAGCVQVPRVTDCPTRAADFVFYDPLADTIPFASNRSVCGISPRTCLSPPTSNRAWQVPTISDWPICTDEVTPSSNVNNTNLHLTCELTGRPCCYGLQAFCTITSRENCDFLEGRYHEEAFLCSQVDCVGSMCGLAPFAERDHPDQVQRLGLALFIHAGVFHLLVSLIFDFIVLRNLEKYHGWISTSILYLGSGIGGNILSAIFVPYSPEVGPSAAIFGVISFFWVFIIYHWDIIYNPTWSLIKYSGITLILFIIGFLPYLDNYARLGGILFGTFFSFIHVNYIEKLELFDEFDRFEEHVYELGGRKTIPVASMMGRCRIKNRYAFKIALLVTGVVTLVVLFPVLFAWFYEFQRTWNGFTYFNCAIPTQFSDLCLNFAQTIRPRPSVRLMT